MSKKSPLPAIFPVTDSPFIPLDSLADKSSMKKALKDRLEANTSSLASVLTLEMLKGKVKRKEVELEEDMELPDVGPEWVVNNRTTGGVSSTLLDIIDKGQKKWEQVSAILEKQIDLCKVFMEIADDVDKRFPIPDPELIGSSVAIDKYMALVDVVAPSERNDRFTSFVEDLGQTLTMSEEEIQDELPKRLWSPHYFSERGWNYVPYRTGYYYNDKIRKVSLSYETDLTNDEDFCEEAKELKEWVLDIEKEETIDPSCWAFSFRDQKIYFPMSALLRADCDGIEDSLEAIIYTTSDFCYKHNIDFMSTDHSKQAMVNGLNFKCSRLEIRRNSVRNGLDVFIPQYYKFSYIKNYSSVDTKTGLAGEFIDLKEAMDSADNTWRIPPHLDIAPDPPAQQQTKRITSKNIVEWNRKRKEDGWSREERIDYALDNSNLSRSTIEHKI